MSATRDERCAACGQPVAPDQEWCLECGAARTLLRRSPGWRIPAALAAILAAAVIAGLVVAVLSL